MIDNGKSLYFTKEEIEELLKKEVGHGTDGRVLPYTKKELLKLYHDSLKMMKENQSSLVDDIKIYDKNKINFKRESDDQTSFYAKDDAEYIRLHKVESLKKATSRQEGIVHSKLPQRLVYIDGHLAGCTLAFQKGIEIHKLTGLPLVMKKKIMLKVLDATHELVENHIYPIDLDNSPFSSKAIYVNEQNVMEKVGHSHVLVTLMPLEVHLIDLDGKSTIYTDFKNEQLEQDSYASFTRLMKEFLLNFNLDEMQAYEDMNFAFKDYITDEAFLDKLIQDHLNYEELVQFISNYGTKKMSNINEMHR